MSIQNNSGTQHCGVRLPGGIRLTPFDAPQLCSPQPSGRADRFRARAEDVADECGNPIPQVCVPITMDYPTCYVNPNAPTPYQTTVLPGFRRISVTAGCGVDSVEILDLQGGTVPGAIEVPCSPRGSLPGQPVQGN